MPLAFDVGGIAVERNIERHPRAHVQANASRWIPHLTRVAGSAAQLETAETIFIAAMEIVAAESLACLGYCRPTVGVVSDVAAIVDRQFDARFGHRYRQALDKR